jgi:CHAD domain-containing protein
MSYRLQERELLHHGIKRIASEEIEDALTYLDNPGDGLDDAVHESRKCFKKLRGLLRLVRLEIGEAVFKRENRSFRDAGRLLSDLRDSRVMIQTLSDVAEAKQETIDDKVFKALKTELEEKYDATRQRVVQEEQGLVEASLMVRAAQKRVADWPIGDDSYAAIAGGLRKIYKRGCNRMEDAGHQPTVEAFHEWRKRVKYLWYSMRVLQPIWPELMTTLADEIHELSDFLGEAHDLAELQNMLKEHDATVADPHRFALLSLLECQRSDLQGQALQQGRLIYPEAPDAFVERIGAYWDANMTARP